MLSFVSNNRMLLVLQFSIHQDHHICMYGDVQCTTFNAGDAGKGFFLEKKCQNGVV